MIRSTVAATLLAAAFVLGGPAAANAHTQVVDPPGDIGPTVTGPISKGWAQAHCSAAAPEVLSEGASGGVVSFTPAIWPGDCPAVPNPGGQVTP